MFPTKNDLPEGVRAAIADNLNLYLAQAITLQLRAKSAHWNVKGATFLMLHQLFDQVATYATDAADNIAERVTALGGVARGLLDQVAAASQLPPQDEVPTHGLDHVRQLSSSLAAFVNQARSGIMGAIDLGDQATADLLIELARSGDKQLWFLEAHIQ